MNLLVIGGTVFVGRHFVEAALSRGHQVALFHRGSKGTGLIADVEEILGDRDGGLEALGERRWDAVVDTCGYVPRVVRQSVDALKDRTDGYLFVSTISVYDTSGLDQVDEGSPTLTLSDPGVEEVTGETYGGLKALCETVVAEGFGDRGLIVRPGLIFGPNDPTNRFAYWVDRIGDGGKVIVPDRPDQPLQLVDARDLGLFMVLALEKGLAGRYNVCGPEKPKTFGDMIEACHTVNLGAELVWVNVDVLRAEGVELWRHLPLTLPPDGSSDAMMHVDNRRAIREGLAFRSWDDSARDTYRWLKAQPSNGPIRFEFSRSKEAEILEKLGL